MDKKKLKYMVIVRFSMGAVLIAAIFSWTAGTLCYWEAWLFMATVLIPLSLVVGYFLRHDPELLERRMEPGQERGRQKVIQALGGFAWIGIFFLPGLDRRFGWTDVPAALVVFSDLVVLAGYFIIFLAMKENRFASRVIKVEEGQTVVTTGPYALVRHPMYFGAGLMLLFTPLALGSYWALVPALLTPVFLAFRILDEEDLLLKKLNGYEAYTKKTRYRLLPRVW